MPKVTFVQCDGRRETFEAAVGETVKDCALRSGVDGIIGECGGAAACGTCHVYVDEADLGRVGEPDLIEKELLEVVAAGQRPTSRLSCQLTMKSELDGLVVHVPDTQF